MIREAIREVIAGKDLSLEMTRIVFDEIMSGKATAAQIAALIVGLRLKGESIDEITGAAQIMRDKATRIIPKDSSALVDTCGTGGDSSGTFNISTAAAFVAAGAGATVAKHGNRSVSSKSGSADVLEALGVNITVSPDTMQQCLDSIGIAFLFAPAMHGAMKHAIGPRKEIGVRTIFNILGPLTNPAGATNQLLGVFSPTLTEPLSHVLSNLGSSRAYVVHGMNSIDEVSLASETRISELNGNTVRTYTVIPEDFGLVRAPTESVLGGDAEENAGIIRKILSGKKGPYRDIVVFNAAFAIVAAGLAEDPAEGIRLAQQSIDSGAAENKLTLLIDQTRMVS
ncbi:MAG: anthranilate phosphoribosyltransferase [Chitinispirillaceae bacterium]